ncbi:hypothetical protein QCA50_019427 [Cerrena zonata]|uniref:Uncharacterized protein n=1 Tax=Cerrena zonata TaxID=2478898 RepID=A0AAW0FAN3_9APHY
MSIPYNYNAAVTELAFPSRSNSQNHSIPRANSIGVVHPFQIMSEATIWNYVLMCSLRQAYHRSIISHPNQLGSISSYAWDRPGSPFITPNPFTLSTHQIPVPRIVGDIHRFAAVLRELDPVAGHEQQVNTNWTWDPSYMWLRTDQLVNTDSRSSPGVFRVRALRELIVHLFSGLKRDTTLVLNPPSPQISLNECRSLTPHPIYGHNAQSALIPYLPYSHILDEGLPLDLRNVPEVEIELDFSGLLLPIDDFESFYDRVLGDDGSSIWSLSDDSIISESYDDGSYSTTSGLVEDNEIMMDYIYVDEDF